MQGFINAGNITRIMLRINEAHEAEGRFVISRKLESRIEVSEVYRALQKSNLSLAQDLQSTLLEAIRLLQPDDLFMVGDADATKVGLISKLTKNNELIRLNDDFPNSYLYRSDPNDVARTEKDTYICTSESAVDVGPTNNWLNSKEGMEKLTSLLIGGMRGRTMYVVPYWLGPIGSPFGQAGIQITDSPYVVINLLIITKAGIQAVPDMAKSGKFVVGIHCKKNLDSSNRYICHFPDENDGNGLIISINTNYGGNALLSKKCHALRIATVRGRKEGWMAEHMMLIGIKDPEGKRTFISGAFPSSSGKTNLSMLEPPEMLRKEGWSTELVSDDIIWVSPRERKFHAINPESGFFGVAPQTSTKTNPNAMLTINRDTIFTNVALGSGNEPYWEGMGDMPKNLIDWTGKEWDGKSPAAHPNSRFTTSIRQYPHLSKEFDAANGAPLSAILYGGRRADLVPLTFKTFSWEHGVLLGAMQRVETTAATVGKVGVLRNDPMAIRPFLAYNMGDYFAHHLTMGKKVDKAPGVFSVNWFRKDENGKFMWPGYSNNMYVMRWVIDMVNGKSGISKKTPIGYVPEPDYFTQFGFKRDLIEKLTYVDSKGYLRELDEVKTFFESFGDRFPETLWKEYYALKERLQASI